MPAPWLLALAFALGLLVLIPARRLQAADFTSRTIGLYAVALWAMGMLLAIRPLGARFLVPILLIAYLAPFIGAPEQVRRVLARGRGRARTPGTPGAPPMKDVTPREPPGHEVG
jgi:hypothetical protein